MRSVSGKAVIGANDKKKILSIPINQLHNVSLKASATCYIGGTDVETDRGLPLEANDVVSFTHQDFIENDKSELDIYAASIAGATVYFLLWRR